MKVTEILVELAKKGVSEEVIANVIPAFHALERIKRRNAYSAKWQRERRVPDSPADDRTAQQPRRANGTA